MYRAVCSLLDLPKPTEIQNKKMLETNFWWKLERDHSCTIFFWFKLWNSLILNAVEQEKLTMVSRDVQAVWMWEDQNSQQLLQQRRCRQCRHQRMEFSKQIRKNIRKCLRANRNLRTEHVFTEFIQFNPIGWGTPWPCQTTQKPVSSNNWHHKCFRNVRRTDSRWKLPHQTCSLVSEWWWRCPFLPRRASHSPASPVAKGLALYFPYRKHTRRLASINKSPFQLTELLVIIILEL